MDELRQRAAVLVEALPYIQRFHGQTVVIKYGGAAMVDDDLSRSVMRDTALLRYVGMRPILVHGGGHAISDMMQRLGKRPQFVHGLRVSDAETVDIAEMVLVAQVGKRIVDQLREQGAAAVGLSGKDGDLLRAESRGNGDGPDLGFVGEVVEVNTRLLSLLSDHGFIPVISSIAFGDDGHTYNVNADHAAARVAAAVGAAKLIMLTDVPGVLGDADDPDSLLSILTADEARDMIRQATIGRGMIPKVEACLLALEGGVPRAHIIDGRQTHALLMEILTERGIGTMLANHA